MLDQLMNPTFSESIWLELLRWGIVATVWLAACWAFLWVPGVVKRQHAHLVNRRRIRQKSTDGLYRL